MLLAIWSPKGGSGTSTVAAACAVALSRSGASVRLVDTDGDQPALLGLSADPTLGVAQWLALGVEAPTDALDRLSIPVTDGLELLPRGAPPSMLAPHAAAEAGAALAVALRDRTCVVDAGRADTPATRALVEVADHRVIVLRTCYLALRRTSNQSLSASADGLVLVDDQRRALDAHTVAEVTGLKLLARIPVQDTIAVANDAGVLSARCPSALIRPATATLVALGLLPSARGRAA